MILMLLMIVFNYSHPLIFPFAFSLVFLFQRGARPLKIVIAASGFYAIVYLVKSKLVTVSYDDGVFMRLGNFRRLFPNYLDIAAHRNFLSYCSNIFYLLPLSLAAIIIVYIIKRQWLVLLFVIGSFIGYLLLINITFPDGDGAAFYMENMYLPLAVMLAMPLAFDVVPLLGKYKRSLMSGMALVLLISLLRIYNGHNIYTARINWERKYLAENVNKKLIVHGHKVPKDTLLMLWGTPYEFALLSSVEQGRTASVIIADDAQNYEYAHAQNKSLITTWDIFKCSDFNKEYFRFADTVSNYTIVK
jgi:hypothetical protein